jgi:hypothetical protein
LLAAKILLHYFRKLYMRPLYLHVCPALLAAGALLLGGCAIYSPTIPATPLLEKGQVEASVGLRLFAAEATAAWAPTNHLLVVAEGALRDGQASTTNGQGQTSSYQDYHHQGGVGLGYYHAPTPSAPAYVAVVGGVGFASTRLRADDDELTADWLPQPAPSTGNYQARYRRYYGQVYIAWPAPQRRVTGGASLRCSALDYTQLTLVGVPFAPASRVFVEPTGFVRFGRGPIRFQLTAGLSLPVSSDQHRATDKRTSTGSVLLGGALVLRPDLFLKQRD